jgi:peptidoglycan/xylan/chitin deacetylase (PgdA/CDA1 family)
MRWSRRFVRERNFKSMSLKHTLFAAGLRLTALTGAHRWLRNSARGRGVILMFHHVRPSRSRVFAPNRGLEITPEFLDVVLTELRREGFEIVSLDSVPDRLRFDSCRQPFAVLTFDDGYRDNVEYAWPILRRHNAPWTLFVTTSFLNGQGRLWWIELEESINRLEHVVIPSNSRALDLPTRTAAQKQAAFQSVYRHLRAGTEQQLRAVVAVLAAQAGVDTTRLVPDLCLLWDEVESLAHERDVSIGAHTLSHPMLATCCDRDATREITESKALLERRLGRPVRHLAYPFGYRSAVGAREVRLARDAGFVTAVTSLPGHVFPDHATELHALPRVSINGLFQNKTALRALLSGVPLLAWNRTRIVKIAA